MQKLFGISFDFQIKLRLRKASALLYKWIESKYKASYTFPNSELYFESLRSAFNRSMITDYG